MIPESKVTTEVWESCRFTYTLNGIWTHKSTQPNQTAEQTNRLWAGS